MRLINKLNRAYQFSFRMLYPYIAKNERPDGLPPIYHYHIRKSGGTSINHAFYELSGDKLGNCYNQIMKYMPVKHIRENGKTYILNDRRLINSGNYFYAHSHFCFDEICLPDFVKTITCFRDPIKRVVSHYRMLNEYLQNGLVNHPTFLKEGIWLKGGLAGFLKNMPRNHLHNQLYMFSARYDLNEALDRVSGIDFVCFTDNLAKGIKHVGDSLHLDLQPRHDRASKSSFNPTCSEIDLLNEYMMPENHFIEAIIKMKSTTL
jgi:hypothetical protein